MMDKALTGELSGFGTDLVVCPAMLGSVSPSSRVQHHIRHVTSVCVVFFVCTYLYRFASLISDTD